MVATIVSSSFSRDSENYNRMIELYGASGWAGLFSEVTGRELFILIVSKIFYNVELGPIYVFLLFSVLSVSIKFYLIDKFSRDTLLSLIFFSSYFFILHDSTQIRFGLAVAFVYLGLSCLAKNRKLLFSLIIMFSAAMFHYSIVAFIVMLFFRTRESLSWLIVLIFSSAVLSLFNYSEIILYFLDSVRGYFDLSGPAIGKLYLYILEGNPNSYLSLVSRRALLVYFCAIVIFRYRKELNAYELLCYNAFLLSIFLYILLKDVEQLQIRASAMFGFSLVFLVPYVHRYMSRYMGRGMAYIILVSFFVAYAVKFTLYDEMLILN